MLDQKILRLVVWLFGSLCDFRSFIQLAVDELAKGKAPGP